MRVCLVVMCAWASVSVIATVGFGALSVGSSGNEKTRSMPTMRGSPQDPKAFGCICRCRLSNDSARKRTAQEHIQVPVLLACDDGTENSFAHARIPPNSEGWP